MSLEADKMAIMFVKNELSKTKCNDEAFTTMVQIKIKIKIMV